MRMVNFERYTGKLYKLITFDNSVVAKNGQFRVEVKKEKYAEIPIIFKFNFKPMGDSFTARQNISTAVNVASEGSTIITSSNAPFEKGDKILLDTGASIITAIRVESRTRGSRNLRGLPNVGVIREITLD